MKRKLFWWVSSLLMGIYASVIFNLETVLIISFLFLVLTVILLYIKPAFINAGLIFCCACVLVGGFYVEYIETKDISTLSDFSGKTVEISVHVCDYPQKGKKYFTLYGIAESVKTEKGTYYFAENAMLRLYDKECALEPGDNITVKAKVLLPRTSEKISDDYSLYLKTKKIYTILSVSGGNCTFVSKGERSFFEMLSVIRRNMSLRLYEILPKDEASLLSAMLLGDKTGLDDEITESFSKSGISHIIAVSGLHVNTICAMLYSFASLFGVNKKLAYFLAVILILIYVPFTGMAVSAVRAGIVAVLFITASVILRRADPLTSLAIAALIIISHNPFWAFSVSFMLSFGATLGILLFCEKITNFLCRIFNVTKSNKILYLLFSAFSITASAQIITAPVIICYFGSFTLWSFITNLFIPSLLLPLFTGGILLILADIIFAPLAKPIMLFVYPILKAIIKISAWFAEKETGIIKAQMETKTILLYIALMLLVYLFLYTDEKLEKLKPDDE